MGLMFALSLNWALGQLGVDPRLINQIHKDSARMMGEALKQTPQEVALLLFTQMPTDMQQRANSKVAKKWARSGKLNVENPLITEAIVALALHNREWWDVRSVAD